MARAHAIVLTLVDLLVSLLLVGWFGFGSVAESVGRISWPQFGMIIDWHLRLFVILNG